MTQFQSASSPVVIRHPVNGLTRGTLMFDRGASRVGIAGDPSLEDLFQLSAGEPPPEVEVVGGRVNVRYQLSPLEWLKYAFLQGWHRTDVRLNTKVAWDLEFRGGLTHLTADLTQLNLGGLEVHGGATHLTIDLPTPRTRVPLRIMGGASHIVLRCQTEVPFRVKMAGGATHLEVGENQFGALGGPLHWASPSFDQADARYELDVYGGASHVSVRFLAPITVAPTPPVVSDPSATASSGA